MNRQIVIAALIVPTILVMGSGCGKPAEQASKPANLQTAQNGPPMGMPPGGPGGFAGQMAKDLGLSDAQKKQLEELDKGGPPPKPGEQMSQADMDAMRKSFEERQRKIESILTPEQKKKFDSMMQQNPMGGPPPGGMPPGGEPPSGPGGAPK